MSKSEIANNSGDIGAGHILRRKSDGSFEQAVDELATEEPLEIRVGDRPLAVTMRTPGNDDELAAGFLLSEAVVHDLAEIREIGYFRYWLREFQPYLKGAVRQFSPGHTSSTSRGAKDTTSGCVVVHEIEAGRCRRRDSFAWATTASRSAG